MKSKRLQFKFIQLSDRVFTGLMLAGIVLLLFFSGAQTRLDYFNYDLVQRLGFKSAPADIVIVDIDEPSLAKLGPWPWPGSLYASLLGQLRWARASVIGLDIIFSEPEKTANQSLVDAIANAGNVVLPILHTAASFDSPAKQILPPQNLSVQAAALGYVNVPLDSDGTARSIYLRQGLSVDGISAKGLPHFAQAVLQVANLMPVSMNFFPSTIYAPKSRVLEQGEFVSRSLVFDYPRKIKFSGPPNHFQRISYAKVLAGDYPVSFFKDKIVLVGVTVAGLGNALLTPGSVVSQPMSRVEFHANSIAAMQNDELIADAPSWFTGLVCILLAMAPLIWLPKLSPAMNVLALTCYFLMLVMAMLFLPVFVHVWVPLSAALIAVVLIYPIWYYRRLKSTQISLDLELQHLRNELAVLGMEPDDLLNASGDDLLQARILKVKLTVKHLRELHRNRNDTVAFISHDIRAPLGAALMLLEQFDKNKHTERMRHMLGRAYNMSESFLQASRAEMINVNKFHELDMVSIVQQAVDEVYELAARKQLKLLVVLPEDSVQVRGDFGLLLRSVLNVLMNAVTYSPEGGVVRVELTRDHQRLILEIVDQGPGIAATKIPKIFRRFSRLNAEHQSRKGSGLGLYFVSVTIKKHHGSVSVQSQLGKGAAFIISLPLERRRGYKVVEHDRRVAQTRSFSDTV